MTFFELLRLLRHYWRMMIACVAACFLLGALAFLVLPHRYEAVASIMVNDPSGTVSNVSLMGTVDMMAAEYITDDKDAPVIIEGTAKTSTSQIYTLRVVADDARVSLETANEVTSQIAEKARSVYEQLDMLEQSGVGISSLEASALEGGDGAQGSRILEDLLPWRTYSFCEFEVRGAEKSELIGLGVLSTLVIALVGGLRVGVCLTTLVASVKRPVHPGQKLDGSYGIPVFDFDEKGAADRAAAFAARISNSSPRTVCLVPARDGKLECVQGQLYRAAECLAVEAERVGAATHADGFRIASVMKFCVSLPLSQGPQALCLATESDVVLVCARWWKDSYFDLEKAIENFAVAGVEVDGIVLFS